MPMHLWDRCTGPARQADEVAFRLGGNSGVGGIAALPAADIICLSSVTSAPALVHSRCRTHTFGST
jgi:hypothetical protein